MSNRDSLCEKIQAPERHFKEWQHMRLPQILDTLFPRCEVCVWQHISNQRLDGRGRGTVLPLTNRAVQQNSSLGNQHFHDGSNVGRARRYAGGRGLAGRRAAAL